MAKLAIKPILEAGSDADLTDGLVSIVSASSDLITLSVGNEATVTGILQSDIYVGFRVIIEADADSKTASRLNKLLAGTGFPKVEKYHRNGQMMVRTKGAPTPVPCVIDGVDSASGYAWTVVSTPTPTTPAPAPETTPEAAPEPEAPAPEAIKVAPVKTGAARDLFRVPSKATTHDIVTSKSNRDVLQAAWDLHQKGQPATVMLEGPAGTGKTSIVDDFASKQGVGVFVFDGAAAASWADWTGSTILTDGEKGTTTKFAQSSFIEAIRADGPHAGVNRIVLVDEVNRAESAAANNALMPILSQLRLFIAEANETVHVDPAVMFVFTMNRGYRGTTALDEALADRMWTTIRMDYLDKDDEVALVTSRTGITPEQAEPLVNVARQVRDVASRGELDEAVSTRSVLQAAHFVSVGMTLTAAAEYCWANAFEARGDSDSDRSIVLTAIKAVLG